MFFTLVTVPESPEALIIPHSCDTPVGAGDRALTARHWMGDERVVEMEGRMEDARSEIRNGG